MKKFLFIFTLSMLLASCKQEKNDVTFDSSFAGARLDSLVKVSDSDYTLYIRPAFEPVNKSPWFAFSVESDKNKTINATLNYGAYKHRYIPKLSYDKKEWKKINPSDISIDTTNGTATLKLNVSKKKLYVSAQELETSKETYNWVDAQLQKNKGLKKVVAGKTVLGKDNFCIELENPKVKNALVLVARQHPPEIPGGTIGFKAFFETLMANTELAKSFRDKFNIYTFPLLNPDGADQGNWRHNANGKDLNRDWIDFSQPETQMVKKFVEEKQAQGKKIQFAIDFHTSYSGPYLLIETEENEAKSKKIIPEWIQNIEANSKIKTVPKRRSQEFPYCYNYFINKVGCEAVTYEDGDEVDRKIIRDKAKVYAENLMKTMLKKLDKNEI